jgi:hypothetical protein
VVENTTASVSSDHGLHREIGHAAPDVDHRLPVDVDRARGADIATLLEVLDERPYDGLEGRLCPPSELDHLGAR